MELTSMTDRIIEVENYLDISNKQKLELIINYAHLLKQPLKLEMFVPCDDNGNVLKEPKPEDLSYEEYMITNKFEILEQNYKQSKEKVLFEGCSTMQQGENTIVIFKHTGIWYVWENKTIEFLIKENLTLTQNATKQFL